MPFRLGIELRWSPPAVSSPAGCPPRNLHSHPDMIDPWGQGHSQSYIRVASLTISRDPQHVLLLVGMDSLLVSLFFILVMEVGWAARKRQLGHPHPLLVSLHLLLVLVHLLLHLVLVPFILSPGSGFSLPSPTSAQPILQSSLAVANRGHPPKFSSTWSPSYLYVSPCHPWQS